MSNLVILIIFIFLAFLFQAALGFLQVRNFAKHYGQLRRRGRVLIGRNPKRLQAGTLLLIALDGNNVIKSCQVMKGITIFAHFKEIKRFNGQSFIELVTDYTQLHQENRLIRQCLLNAYQTLIKYQNGTLAERDFSGQTNFFELPLVTYFRSKINHFQGRLKKEGIMK
ncbi:MULTISPECIES: transcriptional regulator GutM [Loigolactobacillus]|uniref:transcriptional regulator GutM n=1 Tax=Loigolactobacillus TaxID=2767889 RepID=UPI0008307D43|nr:MULTISPECIES: transcriptional regulator GutM [Loigolactobacillus]MDA5387905.1 transcriptional regulator GutM [Loigolactobacillus backii]MDA5390397.1 transcriptional regulator GutM [Loigolactobacillus backii]OLF69919.1 sorbitol operon activator [Loigolactobacillus backii]